MTTEQQLQAIIETAVKHGWKPIDQYQAYIPIAIRSPEPDMVIICNSRPYDSLLFDHKFAQAVWGNEPYQFNAGEDTRFIADSELTLKVDGTWVCTMRTWQYHLQQLAITPEDKRIEYVYNNMRKE